MNIKRTKSNLVALLFTTVIVGTLVAFDIKKTYTPKLPDKFIFTYTPDQLNTRLQVLQLAIKYAGKVGPSDQIDLLRDSLNSYIKEDIATANSQLIPDSATKSTIKH